MTKKPFQEQLSIFSLLGELPKIENGLEEAWGNLKKCTEPFTAQDIIRQQQETINSQKAEIERLERNLEEAFAEIEELRTLQTDLVNEFVKKLKAKFICMEYVIKTSRKTMPVERVKAEVDAVLQNGCPNVIDKILKEVIGDTQCEQ